MNPILEVEQLLTDDERRLAVAIRAKKPLPASTREQVETMRARCINRIIGLVGHGGFQSFLRNRQPALGGLTGAELLQRDPNGLLDRLELLDHEDVLADAERHLNRRSEKSASRVLEILDELERGVQ